MGIPITGTINSFQTKLLAKECKLYQYNYLLSNGVRAFEGVFAGKDCKIVVAYNNRTKQVYGVAVWVDCNSSDTAENTFNYYKDLLTKKYEDLSIDSDALEDSSETYFGMAIFEAPPMEGMEPIGRIGITINDRDDYDNPYYVAVLYTDAIGSSENVKDLMNDL
ncbi:MAG: hypothetical protein HDS73_05350 [Bacteroidales bacterium]|nr:hypothetical protein [Bacteroidales bacterium]